MIITPDMRNKLCVYKGMESEDEESHCPYIMKSCQHHFFFFFHPEVTVESKEGCNLTEFDDLK